MTGLVKERLLLGCIGQVLQRGLWQGKKPGVGRGGRGTRFRSDKESTEVGRMAEGDRGEVGKKIASGGIRYEDVVTFCEVTPQRLKNKVVGGD